MKLFIAFLILPAEALISDFLYASQWLERTYFTTAWDDSALHYQTFSTIAFAAVCDFRKNSMIYNLRERQEVSNLDTVKQKCGKTCTLLSEIFHGIPDADVLYSPSDHTQVVVFSAPGGANSVRSVPIGNDFDDPFLILSFRGTFVWDIINMRRNQQTTLKIVSLCDDCAAATGFWMNFVALRYAMSACYLRAGQRTGGSFRTAVTGTSMAASLGAFGSLWLSANLGAEIVALVTHGGPRVGNRPFARSVRSAINGNKVINFAFLRDPVPHNPAKIFGFTVTANFIYWVWVDPTFYFLEAEGEDPAFGPYLRTKLFSGTNADYEFAASLSFHDQADHTKYFLGLNDYDMASCGGLADTYLLNTNAIALFN